MKNPTTWIYVLCCAWLLFPIGIGLLSFRIANRLATHQPILIGKKEKGKITVMLEIREHEPMAKEEKEDD
jgi:hypothetical protein